MINYKSLSLRCAYFSVVFLLLTYALLGKYDVSKSTFWYYDFLSMSPNILYYLVALVSSIAVATYLRGRFKLFPLLVIVLIFSIEALSNFPLILARDVYLHGSGVRVIVEEARLAEAWQKYPTTHPGTFLLWATVKLVTGMDIKLSNLMILLPTTILLLPSLLVIFYKKIGLNKNAIYQIVLLAFLLMNNQGTELTFIHFNTRLYSLNILILILLVLMEARKTKREGILSYVLMFCLTISHILTSLIPIAFVFFLWLFEDRRKLEYFGTPLLFTVIYLTWNISMAIDIFGFGLQSFSTYFFQSLALGVIAQIPNVPGYVPFFGVVLKTYYKGLIAVLALISVYAVLRMRNNRRIRRLSYLLLSIPLIYGTALFSAALVNSIDRALMVAAIVLAPLSYFALTLKPISILKKSRLLILSLLILVMVIPHFTLVHEDAFARANVEPLDACCKFLSENRHSQAIVTVGDFRIYYCYYEPKFEWYITMDIYEQGLSTGRHSLSDITNLMFENETSAIRVLDFRNVMDWSFMSPSYTEARIAWAIDVYQPIESCYNKIYDNGFETLYH